MIIPIEFNKTEWETEDNIIKLLSVEDVKEEEDAWDKGYKYYINPTSLEELNTILTRIEKAFNFKVDLIISADNLEIFLDFRDE